MQEALQSQIERITPEVTVFADVTWRKWPRANSDVNVLLELPAVQEELAALEAAGHDADANTKHDAVIAAVKAAITRLPVPYHDAGLAQFGYSLNATDKKSRLKKAAPYLDIRAESYRQPLTKTLGMKPWDYVIALVACSLCGASDPLALVAERVRNLERDELENEPPPPTASPRLRWLLLLGGVLAVCVAIVAATQLGGGPSRRSVGTATVSISDPRRIAHLPGPPRSLSDPVEDGRIALEACFAMQCQKTLTQKPTNPHSGEVLGFRLEILDSYRAEIASMNLKASSTAEEGRSSVTAVARWSPPIATSFIETRAATASVAAPTQTADGLPRLEYVGGSTELYEREAGSPSEEVPALKLPDGLFSPAGLTLTHVGFARECRINRGGCPLVGVAIIHFDMRLVFQ